MTPPGALALTGAVLLVVTLGISFVADTTRRSYSTARRLAGLAWVVFAAAASCFIGSVWWEALS